LPPSSEKGVQTCGSALPEQSALVRDNAPLDPLLDTHISGEVGRPSAPSDRPIMPDGENEAAVPRCRLMTSATALGPWTVTSSTPPDDAPKMFTGFGPDEPDASTA
jgi:hypothetical protein